VSNKLLIPTNPDYDVDGAEPTAELANPVTVNNQQVLFANEAIRVTQDHVALNRDRTRLKLELKATRRAKDAIVRDLLRRFPPGSANDTKTLKLLDAYVWRKAEEFNEAERLRLLEEEEQHLEDEIERLEDEGHNKALAMAALKLASQNAMTFLSYVKDEAKRSRFGL
jgi:hypothetical protein